MTQLQFIHTSLIMYLTQEPSTLFLFLSFSVSFHLKHYGEKPRVDLNLVSLYKSDLLTHGLVKVSQGLLQSTASRCHGSSCSLVETQFKNKCRSVEALLYLFQGQNCYPMCLTESLLYSSPQLRHSSCVCSHHTCRADLMATRSNRPSLWCKGR